MRILALLLAIAVAGSVPARAAVLQLREKQSLGSAELTLNDLLQSSQGLSADELSTVIGAAPALGKSDTWTRDRLAAVLPDSIKQQSPQWTGADSCVVSRPAVLLSVAQVRQLITAEIARQLPPSSTFAVLEMPGTEAFPIPDAPLDSHVELASGTLRNEWGDASLQFSSEGRVAVTVSVRFHWSYTRKVWQAGTRVASGDALTSGAFQQVEVNVLKLPGSLQPATDFPEGKAAAHILPPGKILMENDWVEPTLVSLNDLVTILYEHHGISITVQARAMASGVRNEVIEVQNLSSHKVFNARVVDERTLVYDE